MVTDYRTVLALEQRNLQGDVRTIALYVDSPQGRAAARAHIGASRLAWRDYGGRYGDWKVDAVACPPGTASTNEDDLTECEEWVLRVRETPAEPYSRLAIDLEWAELLAEAER